MEVLYGPEMPEQWLDIAPDEAVSLVSTLSRMAEFVLLDLPGVGALFTQALLPHCDRIMMVLRPEADSLASASICLQQLKRAGIGAGRVDAIVVNQAPLAIGMSTNKVTEQLNCKVRTVIPPAADVCANAMKKGRPLVMTHPDTGAAARIRELAAYLVQKE
jgi:MinD-like ATPase involved in chromosome partitioning or flagellar assembly